ncbi:uncharacterized protein LOC131617839 [Vicia villosa]|uniref:uncharacterized protein LOC131617839 n=1 Tax=Vicia villosa TaxID=3911 RepID=UPI00273B9EFF|nr:uncharacterized protein LOC131617839 [Vicia villosa]
MTENWNCLTLDLIIFNVTLASIDGFLAFIAFAQVLRIHLRSQQNGWMRQKVLHIMIGTSNLGYCIYFTSTVFATCNGWYCWSGVCGFILMAAPKVVFLAAFLLLLSFWVDLCHQENEEELDDEDNAESRSQQALVEGVMREQHGSAPKKFHRRCCSIQGIHIGSRQKYVIMIVLLIFAVMMAFAILICVGDVTNPIDPSIVARVYETFLAIMILILAGALGCYGFLLFFKLRKVRSENASSEMWKVISLAIISIVCFSSSALVALNTDIPLFYHWHLKFIYGVKAFVFLTIYYFIGSSLPSAYLLWIIRELPPPVTDSIQEEPRGTYAFISHAEETSSSNHPSSWTTATSSKNQISRASPI